MFSDLLQQVDDSISQRGRVAAFAYRIAGALILVSAFGGMRATLPVPILPFLFFLPAIGLSAFFFGMLSGMTAVATSTLAAIYFFLPPDRGLEIKDAQQGLSVALFAIVMIGIVFVTAQLRKTLLTLRATLLDKDRLNATLEVRIATEVANRVHAEDALRQSQKMEAIGQLAGGIAHDLNNQLAGMSGALELIGRNIANGKYDKLARYISMATGASDRAAALTHRLLAFSRRQTLEPVVCDPNRLVIATADMLRRTLGKNLTIQVEAQPEAWLLRVDRSQLENAILNFCLNARDAMPRGGTITITIDKATYDPQQARERDLEPGDYVLISVADTGTGMDAATCERIFEPFFTTKKADAGTGLGLSMVYGFARQSNGQVRAYSAPGVGTTMRLKLPRYVGPELPSEGHPSARPARGETVLVVDDEPAVRVVMEDALSSLGYNVLSAADGVSALDTIRSEAPIDLLVSDVGMPGMNGRQLAEAGRTVRPDLKVLFVTGYAAQSLTTLAQGMHVMTKPFAIDALGARVAMILAE